MTSPGDPAHDAHDTATPPKPGAGAGESPGTHARRPPIPPSTTRPSLLDADLAPDEPDWPAQATTAIVNLVDQVRDKTTGPVLTVARGLVFGLLAAVLGVAVFVLALIFAIRLLTELTGRVWLSYLIIGAVFTIAGALVFSRRNSIPATKTAG